jgi:hypothetical protein
MRKLSVGTLATLASTGSACSPSEEIGKGATDCSGLDPIDISGERDGLNSDQSLRNAYCPANGNNDRLSAGKTFTATATDGDG